MKKASSLALLIAVLVLSSALLSLIIPRMTGGAGNVGGDPDFFLLSGWAWSSNIGWVNFGNFDSPEWPEYGVKIKKFDPNAGKFFGYAWSPSVGWVNFAPVVGGTNPGDALPVGQTGQAAHIAVDGNGNIPNGSKVLGWARACSVFESGCEGDLLDSFSRGNWDGWALLSGKTQDNQDYGVKKVTVTEDGKVKEKLVGLSFNPDESEHDPNDYLGVWAGDNIGWLSFEEVLIGDTEVPPPFLADCSASAVGKGPYVGEPIEWTISVTSPGAPPYTYCWGGDEQNAGCTPPLGYDVHLETTEPTNEPSYSITRSFNEANTYYGYAKVLDSQDNQAFCNKLINITKEPGQEPPEVTLKANGVDSIEISTTTPLYLTWNVVEDNADSCVGEFVGDPDFGNWAGKTFNYPDVKKYDIVPSPYHPVGDYEFGIKCKNDVGYGDTDWVNVTVTEGPSGGGESELIVDLPGEIIISQQPSYTPAVSNTATLKNKIIVEPGENINVCLKDVISPPSNKSLVKPGGIMDEPPANQPPACWLGTGDVPGPDGITKLCYDKPGELNCIDIPKGGTAQLAIKVYRPLQRISQYHPYDISFLVNGGSEDSKVKFLYTVSTWDEW